MHFIDSEVVDGGMTILSTRCDAEELLQYVLLW